MRATATGAENVFIQCTRLDGSSDVVQSKVGDRDAVCRDTRRVTVEVVLLDVYAVDADVAQGDVRIGDVVDDASRLGYGFDADSVLRIGDCAVGDCDVVDVVQGATTDGTDGKTVASVANAVLEEDILGCVNGVSCGEKT